jgi:hypothetical protein
MLCALRYAIFQVILRVPISFSFLYNPAELREARALMETGDNWDNGVHKKGLIKGSNVSYPRQSGRNLKGLTVQVF